MSSPSTVTSSDATRRLPGVMAGGEPESGTDASLLLAITLYRPEGRR